MRSRSHTLRATPYTISQMGLTVNGIMYFLYLGLNSWGKPFSDLGLYEPLSCVLLAIHPWQPFSKRVKLWGRFLDVGRKI